MGSSDEWIISVDSHLIEPPNVWVDRLPAKYKDNGPRWISDEHGESWLFEGSKRIPVDAMSTNGAVYPPENRAEMFRPHWRGARSHPRVTARRRGSRP